MTKVMAKVVDGVFSGIIGEVVELEKTIFQPLIFKIQVDCDNIIKVRKDQLIFIDANDKDTNYGKNFTSRFPNSFYLNFPRLDKDQIKRVIFNEPATIIYWKDGTKTVVKCQENKGDTYNPELGLAMCIIKKMSGNKGNYNDIFQKWLPEEYK